MGGKERWKVVFTRHNKKWTAKKMYKDKEEDFLHSLMSDVLKAKHELLAGIEPQCVTTFTLPELPRNIAGTERPTKDDVVAAHRSRMRVE